MKNILAIIPARSGSKSIPDKNIRPINNKPMLAYSITHAKESKLINRIIVSTDSDKYADIAKEYGAEVPFLRPKEYSKDDSLDFDAFYYTLQTLRDKYNYIPDIVVHLRPTYPIRKVKDIDNAIEILLNNHELDSVRSISSAKEIPFKMWIKNKDDLLEPISSLPNCYNQPRQNLPIAYYQNACIDVIRANVILEKKSMNGEKIFGYLMQNNFDIDCIDELDFVINYYEIMAGKKTFCFDIDGVIADTKDTLDYTKSKPNEEIIRKINQLYKYGNTIILFTARGYVSKKDWQEVTKQQMQDWGVQYHEIKFAKPAADFYIDDHSMDLSVLKQIDFG